MAVVAQFIGLVKRRNNQSRLSDCPINRATTAPSLKNFNEGAVPSINSLEEGTESNGLSKHELFNSQY